MPKEPKFLGSIGYSKQDIAGFTLYGDTKVEKTLEEELNAAEKADVQSARKDLIVTKLKDREASVRKQGEPNPKRWTVDPDTGRIDVDEEGGDYTQKEAMMISASIKGKSGQYDDAIALITAAKTLAPENQPYVAAEKPKEFYVDLETGTIVKDTENGEYTLSEARAISQSLHKERQAVPGPKSLSDKLEEVIEEVLSKRFTTMLGGDNNPPQPKDPVDEVLNRLDQAEKLKERFGGTGGGVQALAQPNIRTEVLKLLWEDERDRLKMQYEREAQVDRNRYLGELLKTVDDGVKAFMMTRAGKGTGERVEAPQPLTFECGECKTKFTLPAGTQLQEGQQLKCPNANCGKTWTKEEAGL